MRTIERTIKKPKTGVSGRLQADDYASSFPGSATGTINNVRDKLTPNPSPENSKPLTSADAPYFKLLTLNEVQTILRVKRTFVTEHVAAGTMPMPIKLGKSRRASIRFFEHEILQYLKDLAADRKQQIPDEETVTPGRAPTLR